jgi:hypothetical protein
VHPLAGYQSPQDQQDQGTLQDVVFLRSHALPI